MGQYFDNDKLPSKMSRHDVFVLGRSFTFFTDNGVFSKNGLDFGSRLLLESIPLDEVGGKVLDMGCGYGVLGIVLNKITFSSVDMCDVNYRALHLALVNSRENGCSNINIFYSNCYQNVSSKYTCIVTNPPIRAGKNVVYDIVMNARNHLETNGRLFLVVRKQQGAKSLISDLDGVYDTVKIITRKKGFFVVECIN